MLKADRTAGAALVLLALGVLFESRALPLGSLRTPGPAYMPVVLALLLLGFGTLLTARGGRAVPLAAAGWADWRHAVAILGSCVFAALALERIGYRLTIVLILAFLLGVMERRHPLITVAFALALALGSFLLFATILRVPLPRGPLGM
jgi:hypothetical protein